MEYKISSTSAFALQMKVKTSTVGNHEAESQGIRIFWFTLQIQGGNIVIHFPHHQRKSQSKKRPENLFKWRFNLEFLFTPIQQGFFC